MVLLLVFLSSVVLVTGHGMLTQISSGSQVACAVNTEGCTSTNGLKLREVIPRSGNVGVCANPPGCEASFKCDWCGLERVTTTGNAQIEGKWWASMPAANWDAAQSKPLNPCMTKDVYGTGGVMDVSAGANLTATWYVNADHSGLYQYQLMCGQTATNADFESNRISPWKALHAGNPNKEGVNLAADRNVGTTKAETNVYYQKTNCTGAACSYRMNRGVNGVMSTQCQQNKADCFITDTITIPINFQCSGSGILRWLWNSAEGPEVFANCLDLKFGGTPVVPQPTVPTPISPTTAVAPTTYTNTGKCFDGESCKDNVNCCGVGRGCYEKDQYWASCETTCVPGIHTTDVPQYQTPWSCKLLGGDPKSSQSGTTPPTPATNGTSNPASFPSLFFYFSVLLMLSFTG